MSHLRLKPGAVLVVAAALALTGCASQPSTSSPKIAEEDFRDADLDVIFATEFPVTSKADALQRALASLEEGDVDKGLFFYVKALNYDPEDAGLLYRIGRIHDHGGDADKDRDDGDFSEDHGIHGVGVLGSGFGSQESGVRGLGCH